MICGVFFSLDETEWKNKQTKFSSNNFCFERNFFYTNVRKTIDFARGRVIVHRVEKYIHFEILL